MWLGTWFFFSFETPASLVAGLVGRLSVSPPLLGARRHSLPSLHCGDTEYASPGPPPTAGPPAWRPPRTAAPLLGLPNEHCGSDHLPVGAAFAFAGSCATL